MEKAYLWAMVAKQFNVPIASEPELKVMYHFPSEVYNKLQDDADYIVEAIEDGRYQPSLISNQ